MHLSAGRDSLVCDFCDNVYFPQPDDQGVRVLDTAEDERCPVCEIPLVNATLAGVPLQYCQRCRGMLLEMGRFGLLIEELGTNRDGPEPPAADPSELERRINCPQCHHRMETHFYYGGGHVVIDDCENCSLIWLDHGELKRIAISAGSSQPQ